MYFVYILDEFCHGSWKKIYENSRFAHFCNNSFALIREIFAFIRESYAFICETNALIRESYALIAKVSR